MSTTRISDRLSTGVSESKASQNDVLAEIKQYDERIEINRRDLDALRARAMLYNKIHDEKKFREDLEAIKQCRQEEANFRGWYYEELRQHAHAHIFSGDEEVSRDFLPFIQSRETTPELTNGATEHAYQGHAAFIEEKYVSTIEQCTLAIAKCPIDLFSYTLRGRALDKIGHFDDALADLNYVISTYHYLPAVTARAHLYLNHGDLLYAKLDFIHTITHGNESNFKLLDKNADDILRLINPIDTASTITASNLEIMTAEAKTTLVAGNYEEAIPLYSQLIPHDIHNSILYAGRGLAYFYQKKYAEAELDFSLAIWQGTLLEIPTYYFRRSLIHVYLGNTAKASTDLLMAKTFYAKLTKAEQLEQSDWVDAFLKEYSIHCGIRAKDCFAQNNLDTAEILYQLATNHYAGFETYKEYGSLLRVRKKFVDAMEAFNHAIELSNGIPNEQTKIMQLRKELFADSEKARKEEKRELRRAGKEKNKSALIIPSEDEKSIDVKSRVKKKKKQQPAKKVISQPKKHHSTRSIDICLANNKSPTPPPVITLDIEAEEEKNKHQEKLAQAKQRKEREKQKEKLKKAEKIQRRHEAMTLKSAAFSAETTESMDEDSDEKQIPLNTSECTYPLTSFWTASITTNVVTIPDVVTIDLLEIETTIFKLLKSAVPEDKNSEPYCTYLVGGSVVDRARLKLANHPHHPIRDIDFVTNIPCPIFCELLEKHGMKVIPSQEINGLFCIRQGNMNIDIMHASALTPLSHDAKNRDYFKLYVDETGQVIDASESKSCLRSIVAGFLPQPARDPEKAFEKHPIWIINGIYQSVKRDLKITNHLKKSMMRQASVLAKEPLGYLNSRLRKVFSYGCASTGYKRLRSFALLAAIFPKSIAALDHDHAWIMEQMKKTDKCDHPILERIYSSFIVCAVMQQRSQANHPDAELSVISHCKKIISQSDPLIFAVFSSLLFNNDDTQLSTFLEPAIKNWNQLHKPTLSKNEETLAEIPQLSYRK
jgi:tetratricopeptide (TPR) repeat protein